MRTGLFVFTNDLRLHDHPALSLAARSVDRLLCVYIHDQRLLKPTRYCESRLGDHRARFLRQSLDELARSLSELGQRLVEQHGLPERVLHSLLESGAFSDVFISQPVGWYESQRLHSLKRSLAHVRFHETATSTLFEAHEQPLSQGQSALSFSGFRKRVESLDIAPPLHTIEYLPPRLEPPSLLEAIAHSSSSNEAKTDFNGGETAALKHLEHYFETELPHTYLDTRNALDGWTSSTKFSPWLANGCASAREIYDQLKKYERQHGATKSTYWIFFELLWREYFHWLARQQGPRLFAFSGLQKNAPLTSAYAERIARWRSGTTEYPLVNALMRELNHTGYMSNRGRQIVASCLVNELSVDWRFGAAYFEQQLIDYDVASNWGNWQYLAGVGTDPRGPRRFNLTKQAAEYDPDQDYRRQWLAPHELDANRYSNDSVDAADWPIA